MSNKGNRSAPGRGGGGGEDKGEMDNKGEGKIKK